jgi:hypothetical protein
VYGVASKRLGPVDVHFNLGFNIIGAPPGGSTKNPIDVELGAEWFVHPKFDLFAEVNYVGSSSTNGAETVDSGSLTAEIAAEEVVASVGIRAHLVTHIDMFGSFSYDNNDAKLLRTGITIKF